MLSSIDLSTDLTQKPSINGSLHVDQLQSVEKTRSDACGTPETNRDHVGASREQA